MNAKQLYYVLVGCVVTALLGIIGVGYAANKVLSSRAVSLSKVKAESQIQSDFQVALTHNKEALKKYAELNNISKTIVPKEKDQAQTVRDISDLAAQSGIPELTSITFPASTLGSGVATNPGGTVSVASPANALSQVTPVKGLTGVSLLPITVNLDASRAVPYSTFIAFLRRLENNRRTAQVTSVNITPTQNNPDVVSFTIIVNKYIKR